MDPGLSMARAPRWPLFAAAAYTTFPVYGSLIPFRWNAVELGAAWAQFGVLLAGPMRVASRADFAANVLLALPLALLWLAAGVTLLGLRRRVAIATAALGVWLGCSALALGLEFAQVFFGGRQPALSDVVAQSIGAALGVVGFALVPRRFWLRSNSAAGTWQRALGVYLAGVVLYALLPLDLTVSRSDLAAKWAAGKVHPLPFVHWRDQPLVGVVDFVLDAAIWALAAVLVRRWRQGPLGAWGGTLVGMAAALEAAQLLVLSRVVDATDVVAAAAGVAAVALVPQVAEGDRHSQRAPGWRRLGWPMLAAVAIVAVHAWPFGFVTDARLLRPRLQELTWLPFASYATNTELYLVTNVLRRVALYGAFAALCFWGMQPRRMAASVRTVLVTLATAALAGLVEALQVFLPARVVDTGDVLIAAGVAALVTTLWSGLIAAPRRAAAARQALAERPTPPSTPPSTPTPAAKHQRAAAALLAGGLIALAVLTAYAPQVPYNLRELLAPHGWPWPAVVVTAAALMLFGLPAWVARTAAPSRAGVHAFATMAALLGVPSAVGLLLLLGAPRESVHDIVGSPVTGIHAALELLLRLASLLLGVVWSMALGHALHGAALEPGRRGGSVAHLLLHGLWVVPLWHAVVVTWAGTDNLTELMAGGGGPVATACLMAYGVLLGTSGAALWAASRRPRMARLAVAVLVAAAGLWLAWMLIDAGTELTIVKYGRVFSTLQFLLSTDRATYVDGWALVARFAAAHIAVAVLAGVGALIVGAWWLPSSGPRGPLHSDRARRPDRSENAR